MACTTKAAHPDDLGIVRYPPMPVFPPPTPWKPGADEAVSVGLIVGDDMRVSKQPISVGELTGDNIRVLGGIEPGVLSPGVHNLREGVGCGGAALT